MIDEFHSHLEPMKFIRRDLIEQQASFGDFPGILATVVLILGGFQISFSYAKLKEEWNVVKIDGIDERFDQNRYRR